MMRRPLPNNNLHLVTGKSSRFSPIFVFFAGMGGRKGRYASEGRWRSLVGVLTHAQFLCNRGTRGQGDVPPGVASFASSLRSSGRRLPALQLCAATLAWGLPIRFCGSRFFACGKSAVPAEKHNSGACFSRVPGVYYRKQYFTSHSQP